MMKQALFTITVASSFALSGVAMAQDQASPPNSLVVTDAGDVGIGTDTPESLFHVAEEQGYLLGYLESLQGDAVQLRFRSDSGNRRFLAVTNDNTQETQMVFEKDEIQFAGPTNTNDLWVTINASGITTTGAGACNPGPCDAVFRPDEFEVPTIEKHAEQMWEDGFLWGVGQTKEGEPINLTRKTTGILHELEVAHIYIEELHNRLKETETRNDILLQRLETIETRINQATTTAGFKP